MSSSVIHPDNYEFLLEHVYRESGIVLDSDKHYLLEARLSPFVHERNLSTINDLCALMRATADPSLGQQVTEAMTTNETFFFRDPVQYQALKAEVFPRLVAERSGVRYLTFWSAASSTGQEAYSIAMLLADMGLSGQYVELLGTDLSQQVLERARAGRYTQLEVNRGLPAATLIKYFTREGPDWLLKDEVRRMAQFKKFDLRQSMRALGPFDVVFCRNVLIYFDVQTKKRILNELHGTLRPGGRLLLGTSESTRGLCDRFEPEQCGKAVFYKAL